MLKKSKFIFDFATNFGSNIVILLLGIVGSMLTTRYLGPEGMGSFTIITTFSLLFVSLAELGIRQSSIYFIAKDKSLANDVLSSNFFIWIASSIIGISLYFVLLDHKEIELPWLWILIGSLVIPSSIANTFINGIMVGVDKISKNATFNFTNSLFKISITVLFVVILQWSVIGALLALIIPTTTVIFRKYFYLNKVENLKLKFTLDWQLIKQLLLQGFLYAIALFLMTNQKQIPVFVMSGIIEKKILVFME
ncbi:oligosaccharide flippase family protein [Sphingobacterium sp. KU25419]|nr:oligosaccharide flippase family protein [Sphingobacterium sp. KU25419]